MTFSDPLSALQALGKLKTDHPLLIKNTRHVAQIDLDQMEISFFLGLFAVVLFLFCFVFWFLDMSVSKKMRLQ